MPPLSRNSAAGLLMAAAFAPAAFAHHSAAMFDASKIETVTGTVKAFNWTNPHVSLELMADAGAAQPGLWTMEGSSPGVMLRSGWDKRSLNPGDKVTITFFPLRDGGLGGALRKAVLANGKTLVWNASNLPGEAPKETGAPWLTKK